MVGIDFLPIQPYTPARPINGVPDTEVPFCGQGNELAAEKMLKHLQTPANAEYRQITGSGPAQQGCFCSVSEGRHADVVAAGKYQGVDA